MIRHVWLCALLVGFVTLIGLPAAAEEVTAKHVFLPDRCEGILGESGDVIVLLIGTNFLVGYDRVKKETRWTHVSAKNVEFSAFRDYFAIIQVEGRTEKVTILRMSSGEKIKEFTFALRPDLKDAYTERKLLFCDEKVLVVIGMHSVYVLKFEDGKLLHSGTGYPNSTAIWQDGVIIGESNFIIRVFDFTKMETCHSVLYTAAQQKQLLFDVYDDLLLVYEYEGEWIRRAPCDIQALDREGAKIGRTSGEVLLSCHSVRSQTTVYFPSNTLEPLTWDIKERKFAKSKLPFWRPLSSFCSRILCDDFQNGHVVYIVKRESDGVVEDSVAETVNGGHAGFFQGTDFVANGRCVFALDLGWVKGIDDKSLPTAPDLM